MTPAQRYLQQFGLVDPMPNTPGSEEPGGGHNRRDFMRNVGFGGLALGAFMNAPITQTLEYSTQKVSRASAPSDLKITDMRYAVVMNGGGRCPVIRIDTNQGIYGLGEVRDGANWRYALFLKSRIMGMNPCNVEMIFKKNQAVWFSCSASWWSLCCRNGALGLGRQGIQRTCLSTFGRKIPQ